MTRAEAPRPSRPSIMKAPPCSSRYVAHEPEPHALARGPAGEEAGELLLRHAAAVVVHREDDARRRSRVRLTSSLPPSRRCSRLLEMRFSSSISIITRSAAYPDGLFGARVDHLYAPAAREELRRPGRAAAKLVEVQVLRAEADRAAFDVPGERGVAHQALELGAGVLHYGGALRASRRPRRPRPTRSGGPPPASGR